MGILNSQHECFYAASTLIPSASAAAATTVATTPATSDSPDASSMCRASLLPKGCTTQKRSPNHKLMAERRVLLVMSDDDTAEACEILALNCELFGQNAFS
eukprot:scaffold6502_cov38-Cyclotella_meneghiniana.AAC.1